MPRYLKAVTCSSGIPSFKQYVPLKPVKRGFKIWVRANSTNGYICDFSVYTGKEEDSVERDLGPKVVKKLAQPLAGGNYHIFFDNFFSTVKLFNDLLDDQIYACGTFRRDRKNLPQVIKDTKLGMHTSSLSCLPLLLVSTCKTCIVKVCIYSSGQNNVPVT